MKRVLIVGAAKSGLACAKHLLAQGSDVYLSDMNTDIAEKTMSFFGDHKPTFVWGVQPDIERIKPDVIVLSPGVPTEIAPVQRAKEKGIPVISEPELAYLESSAAFVAITGTNGKTTTTTLTAYLLEGSAPHVLCAGNIGIPLIGEAPALNKDDVVVAELSSFQLESIDTFRPYIAVFLNLTPDHLDRHKTMAAYGQCKANIFRNQNEDDVLIYNADDPAVAQLCGDGPSRRYSFSQTSEPELGMWLQGDDLYYRLDSGFNAQYLIKRENLSLLGDHNLENVMAASLSALLWGQDVDVIRERLASFKGVAHRMEPVAEFDGVCYVNDSKGTNPDASIKAMMSYDAPVVIILGGRNKGSDFKELAEVVVARCKAAVLVGEAKEALAKALKEVDFHAYDVAKDFKEAVRLAHDLASAGDVVLLSPACASWDMFENFEVRGDTFKKLVIDLEEKSTEK